MKRQLTKLIGIGSAVILVLAAALVFVGLDISKRVDQISLQRSDMNSRFLTTEHLSVLRYDLAAVQPYIPALNLLLQNKDQLINLPKELGAIAAQDKVDFSLSFSGESAVPQKDLNWIGLNINISGEIGNIIGFLKAVENGRYFIKFNGLDINKKDNKFAAPLNGVVFYFQ